MGHKIYHVGALVKPMYPVGNDFPIQELLLRQYVPEDDLKRTCKSIRTSAYNLALELYEVSVNEVGTNSFESIIETI